MDLSPILPDHFQLSHHEVGETNILIGLVATQTVGRCPDCQMPAKKMHSFYRTGAPAANANRLTHLGESRVTSPSSAKVLLSQ